jgi:biotin operon repressor
MEMDYRSYEKRLEYVLELIIKNRFRSLEHIALRFGCSTRSVKRMLNHLRDKGYPIRYNRQQKKYFIEKKE